MDSLAVGRTAAPCGSLNALQPPPYANDLALEGERGRPANLCALRDSANVGGNVRDRDQQNW